VFEHLGAAAQAGGEGVVPRVLARGHGEEDHVGQAVEQPAKPVREGGIKVGTSAHVLDSRQDVRNAKPRLANRTRRGPRA
jgi:hypothetical protein